MAWRALEFVAIVAAVAMVIATLPGCSSREIREIPEDCQLASFTSIMTPEGEVFGTMLVCRDYRQL